MYKKKRRPSSLTGKLLVLLLLAAVVCGASVWGATARYVSQSEHQGVVKAKEFYFTSDYLVPGGKEYTLNPGTTAVSFELRNYDGLKVSELAVEYTVTLNGEQFASSGDTPIETGEARGVQIDLTGLTPGTYTVTATGYARNAAGEQVYTTTLSATFVVKAPVEGIYKHTENYGDYVILTVWTNGKAANAEVTIPTGLIPDYTDAKLTGKSAGGTIKVELGKDESLSYRFFTTGDYDNGPIPVKVGESLLDETALS